MRHRMSLIAWMLTFLLPVSGEAFDWTPVAHEGDQAPGLGSTFSGFGNAIVLDNDEIVFRGHAYNNEHGIFRWSRPEGVSLWVSQQQLQALYAPGWPTFQLQEVLVNEPGDGMIRTDWSRSAGPGCVDLPLAIHLPRDGGPVPVASVGQAVGDGAYLTAISELVYSDAGEIAGSVRVVDTPCVPLELSPEREGVVGPDGAGGIALVAVQGSPVELDEEGRVFLYGGFATLDDSGRIVFTADLGPPQGPADVFALYRRAPGEAPLRLAATGEPVPGLGPADVLQGFGLPSGNRAGTTVIAARLDVSVPGADPARNELLLASDASGPFETWVRKGDAAPIGVPGATIESFGDAFPPRDLRLSDTGTLAFVAHVDAGGVSREALFLRDTAGALTARAVEGIPPDGFGFEDWQWFSIEHVDGDGSILFQARLIGDGIGPSIERALFLSRPDAPLLMLVRTGEPFELAVGQPEALGLIDVGNHRVLDEVGAVFHSRDSYPSAIFALRVPEARSGAGAVAALLALLHARRKK